MTRNSGEVLAEIVQNTPWVWIPAFPEAMRALGAQAGYRQMAGRLKERAERLEAAMKLTRKENRTFYAVMVGHAAMQLAREPSLDRKVHLVRALGLVEGIRDDVAGEMKAAAQIVEADIRLLLAQEGVDTRSNARASLDLYGPAIAILGETDETAPHILNFGAALSILARDRLRVRLEAGEEVQGGLDSREEADLFGRAIERYERAASLAVGMPAVRAEALLNAMTDGLTLASYDPGGGRESYFVVVRLGTQLDSVVRDDPNQRARAARLEANARLALARQGIDEAVHAATGATLFNEARLFISPNSSTWVRSLKDEAECRLRLAGRGVDPLANIQAACDLLERALPAAVDDDDRIGCLLLEAQARGALASWAVEPRENLRASAGFYRQASERLPAGGIDQAETLVKRARMLLCLAQLGVDSKEYAMTALELLAKIPFFARIQGERVMIEGLCRIQMLEHGIDTQANAETAVSLLRQARALVADPSSAARCAADEALAHRVLAELGVEPESHLSEAMTLIDQARSALPGAEEQARLFCREAAVHLLLAAQGDRPRDHLRAAINGLTKARELFSESGLTYAQCLMQEGMARVDLARLGVDTRSNLEAAVQLDIQARVHLAEDPQARARCMFNEANAHSSLASMGINSIDHLMEAVELYRGAQAGLPSPSLDFARSLVGEANAHVYLAELNFEPQSNLKAASDLYEQALGSGFPAGSLDAAQTMHCQGAVRRKFADLNIDPRDNLQAAVKLFHAAREIYPKDSGDYALSLMDEADAWRFQAIIEIRSWGLAFGSLSWAMGGMTWSEAMYVEAGSLFEKAGRWFLAARTYSGLGQLFTMTQRWEDAHEAFARGVGNLEKIQTMTTLIEDRRHWAEGFGGLFRGAAESALELGRTEQAVEWIERGRSRALADQLVRKAPTVSGEVANAAVPLRVDEMRALAHRLGRPILVLWTGPRRGDAFLIRPEGVESIPLPGLRDSVVAGWTFAGPGEELGWLQSLERFRRGEITWSALNASVDAVFAKLHETVMGPIRERLRAGETRLACVVSGPLGLVPLHAASWTEGGRVRHLLEELELVYAPSAWVLGHCAERPAPSEGPMLGVAQPDGSLELGPWELDLIERLLIGGGRMPLERLIGETATAESVSRALRAHSRAYLSCHGEYDEHEPIQSCLRLARETRLILEDLMRLDLGALRFVALSACESSVGYRPGDAADEYLGLASGFVVAGVKTVVGSLAPVPEMSTSLLMVRFFEELLQGIGAGEALRRAQAWLKELSRSEALQLAYAASFDRALADAGYGSLDDLGDSPFASPIHWCAFGVFGSPDPVFSPLSSESV